MQTFLPYPDFERSAQVLDYRRLGKQRVEAQQILMIIIGATDKQGWQNHPAVRMWRGHDMALALYRDVMIKEWIRRGYNNTMPFALDYKIADIVNVAKADLPAWFGNDAFHASHRSNLLRKDSAFYGRYGWQESSDLEYVWPA
jgi:hypothetical protein